MKTGRRLTRLLGGASWPTVAAMCAAAVSATQGVLIARALSPSFYGVFTLITLYPLLMKELLEARSLESVIKSISAGLVEQDLQRVGARLKLYFCIDTGIGLLSATLTLATAGVASRLLGIEDAVGDMRLFAASLALLGPVGTATGFLIAGGKLRTIGAIDTLTATVQLVTIAGLLAAGFGITALVVSLVACALLRSALFIGCSWRQAKTLGVEGILRADIRVLRGEYRTIARLLAGTNVLTTLKTAQRHLDILVIGTWLGKEQVALYRAARNIGNLTMLPTGSLYQATYPRFASAWQARKFIELRRLQLDVAKLAGAISLLVTIVAVPCAPWIVRIALGESYRPATNALRFILIGVGISTVVQFMHSFLVSVGAVGLAVKSIFYAIVAQAIAFVPLTHYAGIEGAAITFVVFGVVWGIGLFLYVRRIWVRQGELTP